MAKPKGGTLSALFAVSEQERKEFFGRIQERIQKEREQPAESVPPPDTVAPVVPVSPVVTAPPTIPVPHTVSAPPTKSVAPIVTVAPIETVPRTDTPKRSRPKPRRAKLAQDGHSHAEQAVYAALWDAGQPEPDNENSRIVSIGFGRLSRLARLSENNCRLNVRNLMRKLAVEEIKEEHSASGTGKTYRIYGYTEILNRRRAAGMEWVIRTKGVAFVNPATGPEIGSAPPTDSVSPTVSTPPSPTVSVGGPPTVSVPHYRNLSRKQNQESSSSEVYSVVGRALRSYLPADDDAIRQLVEHCAQVDPSATAEEMVHFIEVKIRQHRNMRGVQNPIGLLIQAVPKCFEGGMIRQYRDQLRSREEQGRETARRVLEDPEATGTDREWAAAVLKTG